MINTNRQANNSRKFVNSEAMEIRSKEVLNISVINTNENTNVVINRLRAILVICDSSKIVIAQGEYCWLANCKATSEIEKTIARKDSTELATNEVRVIPMLALTIHQFGRFTYVSK